jgi:hypothetical protein
MPDAEDERPGSPSVEPGDESTPEPDQPPPPPTPPAGLPVGDALAPPVGHVERKSAEERKQILAQQIQFATTRGRRVESQMDFQAVLIEGKPVNHTLHAILTFLTCLVWGVVWAVLAATGGEKRELLVIDDYGNVQIQKMGKA